MKVWLDVGRNTPWLRLGSIGRHYLKSTCFEE